MDPERGGGHARRRCRDDPLLQERKAAILRAARLLQCAGGTDEDREFAILTQAIAEYDLI
ncbi:hypothetical protein [Bosea sp. AAP35]|uniref:hypothetical protein n=1 Tax=Bosea sp. AAP35 TaxID=1523417 RepID=UPI0012E286C8|nr:hypothetical protein [Bosea sp. AAP35]